MDGLVSESQSDVQGVSGELGIGPTTDLKNLERVTEVEIYGKAFKGTKREWNLGLYEKFRQWVRVVESNDPLTMQKYLAAESVNAV